MRREAAAKGRGWLAALICTALPPALGCGSGPRCHGPSQAVTPARSVRAPKLTLAGMKLDETRAEAKLACEAMLGAYREPAFCRPNPTQAELVSPEPAPLQAVDIGFDNFGHAKRIKAIFVGEPSELARQQRDAVSRISAAIGEPNAGALGWCERQPDALCRDHEYAEWFFEGGRVTLESEVDLSALELELTHSHDDMNERVIYGLPTCG